ncbi:MAG: site-2 protease family protein [Planctomycetota bacterium]|jgi:Zn-dependent protease/predicted transcriptional regulator
MFGRRFQLFTLFGFRIGIDLSWFVIAVLITWTLAEGMFGPGFFADVLGLGELPAAVRWSMGAAGALGLFASIVAHELAHSLVARGYGIQMKGITLFIFGGVAEMGDEPPHPEAELLVAIAGPIASMVLGLGLLVSCILPWPGPVLGILAYLGIINLALVVFNMIPAFPLDGGRVLRSLLWAWKRNLRWATRITARLGSFFGLALIILAVVSVLAGNFLGGIWWFLLGIFVRGAARMSYQQLVVRGSLEGEQVRRFMQTQPCTVPPEISVADLVQDHIYRHHFKMFPVVADGELLGCISTREVKRLSREQWGATTVGDLARSCSEHNTVGPDADAMQALTRMNQTGASRLMVVDDGRLVGVIALKDLLRFVSLKVELED